jgi:uncharacterized protein YktB (UPF0637 family)
MNTFNGFHDEDFNVFHIQGLDERMNAIKEIIRPKLHYLGDYFSPTLSTLTGDEMFPHVAKHARRSVNPPDDTWVAFANSKRGYKKLPHFQIGLWETHLFVWFAVIYESPIKKDYAVKLDNELNTIQQSIPPSFVWSTDHTKPEAVVHGELSNDELFNMVKRLQQVKKAEILCGRHIDRNDPVLMDGTKLLSVIEETFQTVLPLYKIAQITNV